MSSSRFAPRSLLVLLAALGPAAPSALHAQWTPGGVNVCTFGECSVVGHLMVTDGAGGAFIAWRDSRNGNANDDVYIQHVLASGAIAPGWPAAGRPVSTAPDRQRIEAMIPDGQGGCFVSWQDRRGGAAQGWDVYASKLDPGGELAPGWQVNGTPVCTVRDDQEVSKIASDGAGGIFAVWADERLGSSAVRDIYAQHLLADGSRAPGWPDTGLVVCAAPGSQGAVRAAADDSGGVFFVWTDGRGPDNDIYAVRLRADGDLAPGWGINGKLLVGGSGHQANDALVPDGSGGVYIGFRHIPGDLFSTDNYVIRVTADGQIASGWPATGVPLSTAPYMQEALHMVPDGTGGVLASWQDFREFRDDAYALRVQPDGSRAPGWSANGVPIVAPQAWPQFFPMLAPDGLGGAFFIVETTLNPPLYSQHLTANGQVAPGWLPDGVSVGSVGGSGNDAVIISDGAGGAIVAFQQYTDDLYAQKLVPDGPVPVQLSLVSSEVTPERVSLTWHVADGSIPSAAVYRRAGSADWRWAATIESDGSGLLRYEDVDVEPGESYGYRLGWAEDGREQLSTETWIEIPSAFTLQLAGFTPNPSTGPVTVSFTLPSTAPATLELLDVTGRRVISRDVALLGPGQHLLRLDDGAARLSPGMYFVRLRTSGQQLISRGAIVR